MIAPDPFLHQKMSMEDFLIGMISLGKPLGVALVGAFDDDGIGSRRDIELPLHKDGVYSEQLFAAQGGAILRKDGINFVGLYCVREGLTKCLTTISSNDAVAETAVDLHRGEALIFDNRRVFHGRIGSVGERILLRCWIGESTA